MSHAADRILDYLQRDGILEITDPQILIRTNHRIKSIIEEVPFIELQPAYQWDCEHCGVENFQRAILSTKEEDEHGVGGYWMLAPDMVTCKSCGAQYLSKYHGET